MIYTYGKLLAFKQGYVQLSAQLINFCATRMMFPKIIYFNGRIYTKIKSEH